LTSKTSVADKNGDYGGVKAFLTHKGKMPEQRIGA